MRFQALHENFKMPTYATSGSAAFDLFTPTDLVLTSEPRTVKLGFAAEVPKGHVGLLVPRSGLGTRLGMRLSNTCGVIDPDYRGEWMATLSINDGLCEQFSAGDRILQCLIVPVFKVGFFELSNSLSLTGRGSGGYGSTGL